MLNASELLSSELWAQIFVHLSPNQWRPGPTGLAEKDVEQYPHLHKLQLVCRKFENVFREHHHLFGALFLRENLGVQALPGLLAWLQRHNSDISFLQGVCSGPCADVALTSLVGTQKLTRVDLTSPTDSAIQILSVCSSLVACTLRSPSSSLNLDRLRRLQKLGYIFLIGGTFSIPLTSQLTTLILHRADVDISAVVKDGCGLQQLCMRASVVRGLENGISTLFGLRGLSCIASHVQTLTDAYKLNTRRRSKVECGGLSTLTQLEGLTLQSAQSSYPSLEPVYALVSLRSLTLAGGGIHIDVTTELSCLTNLTQLTVRGDHSAGKPRNGAKLTMQWSHIPALQVLHFICVDFLTDDMTVLMNSKDLKVVNFAACRPANVPSSAHFAKLAHLLGSEHPEVKFMC